MKLRGKRAIVLALAASVGFGGSLLAGSPASAAAKTTTQITCKNRFATGYFTSQGKFDVGYEGNAKSLSSMYQQLGALGPNRKIFVSGCRTLNKIQ